MDINWFVVMMTNIQNQIQIYRGEKAVYQFMENMLEEVKYCKNSYEETFQQTIEND